MYMVNLKIELKEDDDVGEGGGEHCCQSVQLYTEES